MRIAFVGKGGAGKTTLATFFVEYLLTHGTSILALDADLNIHFAKNLGMAPTVVGALSEASRKQAIRTYLRGVNTRITGEASFVKTTPPGTGSTLIEITPTDSFIAAHTMSPREGLFVAYVGTYEADEIGTSCYHTNLTIAENIVSHLLDDQDHWLVTDMVAGTDAFSGSLHLLFDAIFLVVEPTPEGVAVYEQYRKLAEAANIWDHVWVLGNKIREEADEAYLLAHIGEKLVVCFNEQSEIRGATQRGERLSLAQFATTSAYERLVRSAEQVVWQRQEQLQNLYSLHLRHAQEGYIQKSLGDITGQIDPNFLFPKG